MANAAFRGRPTPPVGLPVDLRTRIDAAFVDVPERVRSRLSEACSEVIVDPRERAERGRDWWPLTIGWALHGHWVPCSPALAVRPASVEEVSAVLRICNSETIPVTTMAGRSGVCGASLPVHGGVALDVTGLAGVHGVDDTSLTVDVAAGTFGDVFEDELRAGHGLTLGHWPQSIALSTVGGWLACRSAGQYSTRYGKIEDLVAGLEVVLADGRVLRTGGRGPRESAGPDLTQVFVGSEGTLGVITAARLRVRPLPAGEDRRAFGFSSFAAGLEACRRILRRGATPAVLRLYDERESARSFGTGTPGAPDASNVMLVLDEADPALVSATMALVDDECSTMGASSHPVEFVGRWLAHRNDVSGLESVIANEIVLDTIEIAAPWRVLPAIHAAVSDEVMAVAGAIVASCHQSHAYTDGACLYFTFAGRPVPGDADAFYRQVWDVVMAIVLRHGGATAHHHGIGLNRARFMEASHGAVGLEVLGSLKAALDPKSILNPGKLGLPDPFGPVRW